VVAQVAVPTEEEKYDKTERKRKKKEKKRTKEQEPKLSLIPSRKLENNSYCIALSHKVT
jgi:hypothetical protein